MADRNAWQRFMGDMDAMAPYIPGELDIDFGAESPVPISAFSDDPRISSTPSIPPEVIERLATESVATSPADVERSKAAFSDYVGKNWRGGSRDPGYDIDSRVKEIEAEALNAHRGDPLGVIARGGGADFIPVGGRPGEHAAALRAGMPRSVAHKPVSMEDMRRRAYLFGAGSPGVSGFDSTSELHDANMDQGRRDIIAYERGSGSMGGMGSGGISEEELAARAAGAKERLVSDPERGLSMNAKGAVVGSGGTPVDETKALAARLAREAEHAKRLTTLRESRKPQGGGFDLMAFLNPQGYTQMQIARMNAMQQAQRDQMAWQQFMAMQKGAGEDRELKREDMRSERAYRDKDLGIKEKSAATEELVTKEALKPGARISRLPSEVLAQRPELLDTLTDEITGNMPSALAGARPPRPTLPSVPSWAMGKTPTQIFKEGKQRGYTDADLVKVIRQSNPGRFGVSAMSPEGVRGIDNVWSSMLGLPGAFYYGGQVTQGKLPRHPIMEVNPALDPWAWMGWAHPASQQ